MFVVLAVCNDELAVISLRYQYRLLGYLPECMLCVMQMTFYSRLFNFEFCLVVCFICLCKLFSMLSN